MPEPTLLEAARIGIQLTQMLLRDTNSVLPPHHAARLERARRAVILHCAPDAALRCPLCGGDHTPDDPHACVDCGADLDDPMPPDPHAAHLIALRCRPCFAAMGGPDGR